MTQVGSIYWASVTCSLTLQQKFSALTQIFPYHISFPQTQNKITVRCYQRLQDLLFRQVVMVISLTTHLATFILFSHSILPFFTQGVATNSFDSGSDIIHGNGSRDIIFGLGGAVDEMHGYNSSAIIVGDFSVIHLDSMVDYLYGIFSVDSHNCTEGLRSEHHQW